MIYKKINFYKKIYKKHVFIEHEKVMFFGRIPEGAGGPLRFGNSP